MSLANRKQLEIELARAEAIVQESDGSRQKRHGPTIDNFRGQAIAYRKSLSLLAIEEIMPDRTLLIERKLNINISWKVLALLAIGCIMFIL